MRFFAGVSPRWPFRALTALALLLGSLVVVVEAQPAAPPPPKTFFSDSTGVVPADAAERIEQRLREFEKASSNQILVVVADRIPDGYGALEEYTNRTAEAWRVGDRSRDNGAVLFVFVGERKVRIEVGYGLEGALPDALASRIINDEITPQFREGKYGDGLIAGVEAIIKATRGEYQPIAKGGRATSQTLLIVAVILFFAFFGAVVPILKIIAEIRGGTRTYTGHGRRGSRWGSGGGFSSWGGSSGGGSSWGGGGGGFSGGGGSFGGGGASGSW